MTVMTYELGPAVPLGEHRALIRKRLIRMLATDFAEAFAAGKQLPLGSQLDAKVAEAIMRL